MAGLNALLADAKAQQSNGTYDPTDAERRFHEWAFKIIINPVMPNADIKLIEQVIKAYNDNINLGHVPFELIATDTAFWGQVMHNAICENYIDCDSDTTSPNLTGPDCAIVSCADALHQSAWYVLEVSIDPYSCYEGTGCSFAEVVYGTGELEISISSADAGKHTKTPSLKYKVSMATKSEETVYLVATGELQVG